jgi:2-dehydro-3-deoxyphosphooctonate aldolase (KDO 8-P synthase)
LFVEVHNDPKHAKSDGANALHLDLLADFWRRLTAVDQLVKRLY